jgi:uncharacterized protein YukE
VTDIVDRLRGPFGAETDAEAISLMQEAADEIELLRDRWRGAVCASESFHAEIGRLREALERIMQVNDKQNEWLHSRGKMVAIARAALSRTSEEA